MGALDSVVEQSLVDAVLGGPLFGLVDVILGAGGIPTDGRRRHEVYSVSGGQLSAGTDREDGWRTFCTSKRIGRQRLVLQLAGLTRAVGSRRERGAAVFQIVAVVAGTTGAGLNAVETKLGAAFAGFHGEWDQRWERMDDGCAWKGNWWE